MTDRGITRMRKDLGAPAPRVKRLAAIVLEGVREEGFAFTVDACGSKWDVYRFTHDGKRGTLAFKLEDGRVIISVFKAGELTREQTLAEIVEANKVDRRENWVNGYVRNGIYIAGYYRGKVMAKTARNASSMPGPRSRRRRP